MKVFLHYEDNEDKDLHKTSKITLPKTWLTGECRAVLKLFVDSYNKKFEANPLDFDAVHLAFDHGGTVANECVVNEFIRPGSDVYIKHGPAPSVESMTASPVATAASPPTPPPTAAPASSAAAAPEPGKLVMCKRFGCQTKYDIANNPEGSCRYHRLPPVFHETVKFWACCPDKKRYSWDSFMQVQGCMTGRHTDVKPDQPSVLGGSDVRAGNDGSQSREKLKSIDEFNAERRMQASAPGNAGEAIAKMYQLRQALEKGGVDGGIFDAAKEATMKRHGGNHVAVLQEINDRISETLGNLAKE